MVMKTVKFNKEYNLNTRIDKMVIQLELKNDDEQY